MEIQCCNEVQWPQCASPDHQWRQIPSEQHAGRLDTLVVSLVSRSSSRTGVSPGNNTPAWVPGNESELLHWKA